MAKLTLKHFIMRNMLLVALLLSMGNLWGTHIVGGEITYECLGNDSFLVKVNVFRDCYNGVPPFDDPASIGVFDAQWKLITHYLVSSDVNDTLDIFLTDPCFQVPPNVCVHRTAYTLGMKLPFIPGGYHLVYQRCCRNLLIQNIIDPEATGASFVADINEASLTLCNNSAVFKQWPPVAICINQPIIFDHGATDADGDSLVYKICTPNSGATATNPMPQPPFAGPYAPVQWVLPYSTANVLGGIPLTIDPNTGILTGTPNRLGNFVVGICVEEYRNGQLISSTNRDFQYNVADCGLVAAAFQGPAFVCEPLGVQFINQSGQGASYQWYFDWPNTSPSSTTYHPFHTYSQPGFYEVALIVNPDQPCSDTTYGRIEVKASYVEADFTVQPGPCTSAGIDYQVTNLAIDTAFGVQSVQWSLTGPGMPTPIFDWEPMFTLNQSGVYTLTMNVNSLNGCTATLSDTIEVALADLNGFSSQLTVCLGDSAPLYPAASPLLLYQWSPAIWLSDTLAGNPITTPSANITYQVFATNPVSGCTQSGSVSVNVSQSTQGIATANPPSVYPGQSTQLDYLGGIPNTVIWSPEATLSNSSIINPIATPTLDTTFYTVIADYDGCFDTAQVRVVLLPIICIEPYVFLPTGFSPNGDNENDDLGVEGNTIEAMHLMIYDRWGEKVFESFQQSNRWDGSFRGQKLPPDTYGYHLEVVCIGGDKYVKQGNITLLK